MSKPLHPAINAQVANHLERHASVIANALRSGIFDYDTVKDSLNAIQDHLESATARVLIMAINGTNKGQVMQCRYTQQPLTTLMQAFRGATLKPLQAFHNDLVELNRLVQFVKVNLRKVAGEIRRIKGIEIIQRRVWPALQHGKQFIVARIKVAQETRHLTSGINGHGTPLEN